MKSEFSTSWKGSKQPRKQRKYRYNAPIHLKRKLMSANLSKDLRKRYNKRSFPIRKGDEVKIMRGEFKKKKGKIETVDNKNERITIAGIFKSKKDGTKIPIYLSPSNVQIIELNLEDKKRIAAVKSNAEKLTNKNERKMATSAIINNNIKTKSMEEKHAHKKK